MGGKEGSRPRKGRRPGAERKAWSGGKEGLVAHAGRASRAGMWNELQGERVSGKETAGCRARNRNESCWKIGQGAHD